MNSTHIAISIVVGCLFISAAILFKDFTNNESTEKQNFEVKGESANTLPDIDPSRTTDRRVYGNESAPTKIVEFSDFECPFCARLHPTLKKIVDNSNGEIAWEYRHMPLPNHSNALPGAIASECIARVKSNDAFWKFSEVLFANIGKHSKDFYLAEAKELGVNEVDFLKCLDDETVKGSINEDSSVARQLGGNGTPFSIIVDKDGKKTPVSGALPYEQWMNLLGKNN
jgi:protein-disulfide isomerase